MPLLLLLIKPLLFFLRKVLKPLVVKYLWGALRPILAPIWNRTGGPLGRRLMRSLPRVERVSTQPAAFVGTCAACTVVADHQIERVQQVVKTPAFLPNIGTGPPRRTAICPACEHRRPIVDGVPRMKPSYRPVVTSGEEPASLG